MGKSLKIEHKIINCKNCGQKFKSVWVFKNKSIIGLGYVLICTGCQKLIDNLPLTYYNELIKFPNILYDNVNIKPQIIKTKLMGKATKDTFFSCLCFQFLNNPNT